MLNLLVDKVDNGYTVEVLDIQELIPVPRLSLHIAETQRDVGNVVASICRGAFGGAGVDDVIEAAEVATDEES